MIINNLDYLEFAVGLTVEGGKGGKVKSPAPSAVTPRKNAAPATPVATPGTATASADSLSEAFGPFTSTYGVSGASTTPFSALSTSSVRSTSSNTPIAAK
jgi:hypothetical protein